MYIAYDYETGDIIAQSPTILGLSKKTNISRITIGKHISKNTNRELYPMTYMGKICFINDKCTEIMTKLPDDEFEPEIFHVYKASTGEYICPCTLQALCDRLDISVKAGVAKSVDNYVLTKYNIFLSRTQADSLPPKKSVYEIFTDDNNLVLSTFHPDNYKYWKPVNMTFYPNPYKPNHYMVKLPYDFDNLPPKHRLPVIDYLERPENILLDSDDD